MESPPETLRDGFLRLLVLSGVLVAAATESLGALHLLRRGPLVTFWCVAAGAMFALAVLGRKRYRVAWPRFHGYVSLVCCIAIAGILVITAIIARSSPPNSADAMAYHMPRVVYWAEQASVHFFPTPYLNQIMLQPFAEYVMLHTYLLTGGDHWVNLIQWTASLSSALGVSAIAALMGFTMRGQAIAALFCATLPSGILASTGAKNDYVLALWLVLAVYFALRFAADCQSPNRLGHCSWNALFFGAALGLALLTKATGYLYAPFLLMAVLLAPPRKPVRPLLAGLAIAAGAALALNAPQYVRNYGLSGSVLGFDSAQGDGVYRWRNEAFGWKETTSNVLRNLSEQLGERSHAWNQFIYDTVMVAHRRLGIGADDPRTTWPHATFAPPQNANHEANAPNPWHLAIVLIAGLVLILRALQRGNILPAAYTLALLCAFLAFCAYLKWQPFSSRLLLPLFVLAAPLAAAIEWIPSYLLQIALCLFLVNNARHALFENWVRPLRGDASVLHVPRDLQYFADMTQWNNRATYLRTVDVLATSGCGVIGLDITDLQLEYPLQALLRERKAQALFLHTGVQNASARYPQPVAAQPCAVVCLECAGDEKRLQLYGDFRSKLPMDSFVIFRR